MNTDTNLLQETRDIIHFCGKSPDDIKFIGSRDGVYSCTWTDFESLANFDYDRGYGAQKVASDLVIVFKDSSYFSRHEYDGSERWVYNKCPKRNKQTKTITRLLTDSSGWETIEEMNTES